MGRGAKRQQHITNNPSRVHFPFSRFALLIADSMFNWDSSEASDVDKEVRPDGERSDDLIQYIAITNSLLLVASLLAPLFASLLSPQMTDFKKAYKDFGEPLRFGHYVNLLHVVSNKVVTKTSVTAGAELQCLEVALTKGISTDSYFQVRLGEGGLERSDSKSNKHPTHIADNLLLFTSLLTTARSSPPLAHRR